MDQIIVDFAKETGKVKPMHSVNNGPKYKFAADQRITNIDHYKAAGIPYARTHDASFDPTYGGEHTVDVNFIFTDWSKDATDPASYDFALTDEYLRVIEAGGAKVYYRLGSKIEHWSKKYNTLPPVDFHKWAVVCEHIIRHYTEGWADGYHMDIEYWEIWNEPDLDPDDSTHKRCWGGTAKEFYELFRITLEHLKACFPHLKIGGPACAGVKPEWVKGLFASLGDVKPDFFSWHVYSPNLEKVLGRVRLARELLDEAGLTACESILNEWNYVKGWHDEEWIYSLKSEKGLKGAAFTAAVMEMCQYEPLDHLMYYDARPCAMNGLFSTDFVFERLKGYYPFYMFNQLYRQEKAVAVEREGDDVWAVAAKGTEQNVMLTYYNDDDNAPAKDVKVTFQNVENKNGVRLEYYCLDANHDAELVREEIFTATEFAAYIKMPLFTTYLLKIVAL
ncbi:MAG: hypothetical protein E7644_02650 [Ruminococcaceae bacterium]|nr:hypothetical protein [Oscillospiraceae bacterium]